MSNNKKKTGRKTRKNRRNRHLKFIREPILDGNGKKIGEREAQVPRDYKTEQTEVHRTDATVINNPPKEHKPCCESQEKIDKKTNRCLGNYEAGQFYESGITVLVNMRPSYHRVSKGNIGNTWVTSFGF